MHRLLASDKTVHNLKQVTFLVVSADQTWDQLLLNVIHYITITFKLQYNYKYRDFDHVMHYITVPKIMHYITITLKDSELYSHK